MPVTEDEKAAKARDAALQGALTQIERQFGKGTVMRMGDEGAQVRVQAVPTGALSLDIALGVGGMPRGRIVEVFGPESSGKTTLTLQVIAEMQKQAGQCAFVDAVVLVDGFVRGRWKVARAKRSAELVVEAFVPIPRAHARAVREEAERMLAFAAPEAERRAVRGV